jgi:hypothetical protein
MNEPESKTTVECPRCKGAGHVPAFVHGGDGTRFDPALRCGTCKGGGRISLTVVHWLTIGHAHYKARVARRESVAECAARLGIRPAELSGMEHGRLDPARLEVSST